VLAFKRPSAIPALGRQLLSSWSWLSSYFPPVTLTFEIDLDIVMLKPNAKYLRQRSVFEHIHRHIQRTDCSTWTIEMVGNYPQSKRWDELTYIGVSLSFLSTWPDEPTWLSSVVVAELISVPNNTSLEYPACSHHVHVDGWYNNMAAICNPASFSFSTFNY